MCSPRITDRFAVAALRRAADLLFELEQDKIVEVLVS